MFSAHEWAKSKKTRFFIISWALEAHKRVKKLAKYRVVPMVFANFWRFLKGQKYKKIQKYELSFWVGVGYQMIPNAFPTRFKKLFKNRKWRLDGCRVPDASRYVFYPLKIIWKYALSFRVGRVPDDSNYVFQYFKNFRV